MRKLIVLLLLFIQVSWPQYVFVGYNAPSTSPGGVDPSHIKVWYRSDNLTCTSGCSGTNVVTSLNDKSGNSNNCSTVNSPTFLASAVNSQPGITFNGSTQRCLFGATVAFGSGETIFIVVKGASTAGKGTFVSGNSGAFNYTFCDGCSGGGVEQGADVSNTALIGDAAAAADTSYHQLVITYDGTNLKPYIASTTDGTGCSCAHSITANETDLMDNFAAGVHGQFCNCVLVELAIWSAAESAGNVSSIQSYSHTRYGL